MSGKTNSKHTKGGAVISKATINHLKNRVEYYEQMHRDARSAIRIAARMSLEMKEQLIEAREKLERAKLVNSISMTKKRNEP